MSTSTLINIALLALAGLSALVAVIFLARAFGATSRAPRGSYNVGQVEARRSRQINIVRAIFAALLALIFIGVYGILPSVRGAAAPDPTETSPGLPAVVPTTPTEPLVVSTIPPLPSPAIQSVPSPTPQPEPPTATPLPSPTPVPQPATATVSSGVGVWLRSAPGTASDQLEWLLDGTVVTMMDGQQTADELLWQQVRTEGGAEGWVARDYLVVEQAQP